jgi:Kef-type K+ transport system membrane component KefB
MADFGATCRTFSVLLLLVALLLGCGLKVVSIAVGAKLAGFRNLDTLNLAISMNARGGPGIVLASVAYDAGIINASFYTTLVLLALLSSQAAGAWLQLVLARGWPLLSHHPGNTNEEVTNPEVIIPKAA